MIDIETILIYCVISAIFIAVVTSIIVWILTHRRPLNENEIIKLSKKRKKKEVIRINNFSNSFEKGVRYEKVVSLNAKGIFIPSNISANKFPQYIASQLFGKKHEWWIIGLVSKGEVIEFWTNKGANNSEVSLSIPFDYILKRAATKQCTSLLSLHNHPNSNPQKFDTLIASSQDKITASNLFNKSNENNISLFSFVCARGEWLLYGKSLADNVPYIVPNAEIDFIKSENGQTKRHNLKLHLELLF